MPELFAIFISVRFESGMRQAFLEAIDDALFATILHYLDDGDRWSVYLVETCGADEAVQSRLIAEAGLSSGVRRDILRYCATHDGRALFSAIETWSQCGSEEELRTPAYICALAPQSWIGAVSVG